MKKRVILSIDGGGIRGLLPIVILKKLNELMKKQLQSKIDLYAGTSTGSLIGGALMLKTPIGHMYSITDILNLYSNRSSGIFIRNEEINQNPLKLIMEKTFQNIEVKDQNHDFYFTTEDNQNSSLHTITNKDQNYQNIKLSQILLACSAVKGYFDPIRINGKTLSDGVTVLKNPSLSAFKYYENLYPEDQLTILSLGTGDVHELYQDPIEESVNEIHETLTELNQKNKKLNYFRLQPKIKKANYEMNDTSSENIRNLIHDAQSYIESNFHLIDSIRKAIA